MSGLILLVLIGILIGFVVARVRKRMGLGVTWSTWVTTVVVVGFLLGNLVAVFTHFDVSVPMEWAVIGLVFCSVVGIAFGMLPAVRASQLHPIDALRYE